MYSDLVLLPEFIEGRYIIGALLLVLAILFSAYHEKIVIELEPASQELRE